MSAQRSGGRRSTRLAAASVTGLTLLGLAGATGVATPAQAAPTTTAAPSLTQSFDQLTPSLTTRVDETGIPADLLGFTHTAPSGWSVTTSPSVTASGVTEWRGWSFATPSFWAKAQGGQGRENFSKASGVLAVADDDEWDDKNSPTDTLIYDSALTSPAIDVSGKKTVYANFDSSYRQTGPQEASLQVSFDGKPATDLFRYTTATLGDQVYLENKTLAQPITVPAGATSMKLTWDISKAQNDWYWAVDNITVDDQARAGAEAPIPHQPGPEDLPKGTSKNKVLFIDLDGVRYDKLPQARTPNMDALARTGQFGPSYIIDNAIAGTNSGPGHSNMLTGVWPDKHQVLDNSFGGNDLVDYPDVFDRIEKVKPGLSTLSTADWTPLNDFLITTPDVKIQQTGASTQITDRASTNVAIDALSEHNPDFLYVYQHSGDSTGHGIGDQSPEYITAIETIDANIGQMITAMKARKTYSKENWEVIIATDHGFAGTSHGGDQHSTRTGWTLATGGDIAHVDGQAREWRQVDVAATILKQLRVPIDPAWGFDGIPIGTPSTDPLDTVATKKKVVDLPAKPDNSGGWSTALPAGWDRANKTKDGATEVRGWRLMTGEFWTTGQEGEGRGSFVRGRDTIAVADPTEWNSVGNPVAAGKTYDSTLWTPWQTTRKSKPVTVDYLSHYQQAAADTGQHGEVVAEFNNGTSQVLWSSTGGTDQFDISKAMHLSGKVPAGATQVRIGWHLQSAGTGYWAMDAPTVTT